MYPKSLKHTLLLTVTVLVVITGIIISQVIIHRYSESLLEAAIAQAENIAHKLALDVADTILINDLVTLQKMLDTQIQSHPSVAYIFIMRDDRILTHTFTGGVPVELIDANSMTQASQGHLENIISDTGQRYLDIAWPIFAGKAGTLRLGFSEQPYRTRVNKLWLQVSLITLAILLVAYGFSHYIISRLTHPLIKLAQAAEKVDEGNLETPVDVKGHWEVEMLSAAFNGVLSRLNDYTQRLEEGAIQLEQKNKELDLAHRQTKTLFEIAKTVSALPDLNSICVFLIKELKDVITCRNMVVIVISEGQDVLIVYSGKELKSIEGPTVAAVTDALKKQAQMEFVDISEIPLTLDEFKAAKTVAVLPLHHERQLIGAVCVGCPGDCNCVGNELGVIEMVLSQTAGAIRRAATHEDEIRGLKTRIEKPSGFHALVGKDPQMQIVYKLIEDVASSDATVLILGESGTGKELVAHAIHKLSPRNDKPFVVVNCSAYPTTLLESELFGYEKGAFTGANRQKPGRFETANGGTVFLDEIGDISATAQIKLLRVLQTRKFERVGGNRTLKVDVRFLAATNSDLLGQVKRGRFREDLYYRLNVIPVQLPPLRHRRNDIPLLARHFLRQFSAIGEKRVEDFSTEAMRALLDYSWPGNVRELENSVEHGMVLTRGGLIQASDLPAAILNAEIISQDDKAQTLQATERELLVEVLLACDGNKKEAARRLGIGRSTLYSKLKRYHIGNPLN
jgi:transcriptional regulator with GAF, ATPase, and Fis domain